MVHRGRDGTMVSAGQKNGSSQPGGVCTWGTEKSLELFSFSKVWLGES